jgi:hypothetical protein
MIFHILLRFFWVSVYTDLIIFYLIITLRCRQADIVATVSSTVSLLPAINHCRCHEIDESRGQCLITGFKEHRQWDTLGPGGN